MSISKSIIKEMSITDDILAQFNDVIDKSNNPMLRMITNFIAIHLNKIPDEQKLEVITEIRNRLDKIIQQNKVG